MPEAPKDLDALFEEETRKVDRCFVTSLPSDVQEFLARKVKEYEARGERVPWTALGKTLQKAGYSDAAEPHKLDYHFTRGHESS